MYCEYVTHILCVNRLNNLRIFSVHAFLRAEGFNDEFHNISLGFFFCYGVCLCVCLRNL